MNIPTVSGAGNLPKVVLVAQDGARAEIYLQGAHLTSWIPAGAQGDRLFLSARSRFSAGPMDDGGAGYRDKVLDRDDCRESEPELRIADAIDRVYRMAPQNLEVPERARSLAIRACGFPDTVVWNPGAAAAASLADLEPGGEQRMLCVEAAAAAVPVVLAAGATWRGSQRLTAR